jgi:hypothetical protein
MAGSRFDFLAGALFCEDYTVMLAALIPHAVAAIIYAFCSLRGALNPVPA